MKAPVRCPSVRFPSVAGTEDRGLETPTHAMSGPMDHPSPHACEHVRASDPSEEDADFPRPLLHAGAGVRDCVSPTQEPLLKMPLGEATFKASYGPESIGPGGALRAAPAPRLAQT